MTPRDRPWWHTVESRAEDPTAPARTEETPSPAGEHEPWAGRGLEVAVLSEAQRAVLTGLDDQPDGPRLDGVAGELADQAGNPAGDQPDVPRLRPGRAPGRAPGSGAGNGTGNPPGDAEAPDPHTRTRWTKQEREG